MNKPRKNNAKPKAKVKRSLPVRGRASPAFELADKAQHVRALTFIRKEFGNDIADNYQEIAIKKKIKTKLIETSRGVAGIEIELSTRFGERIHYQAKVNGPNVEYKRAVLAAEKGRQATQPGNVLFPGLKQKTPFPTTEKFPKTQKGLMDAAKLALLDAMQQAQH